MRTTFALFFALIVGSIVGTTLGVGAIIIL
jgi:hypothetical protein